MQCDTQHNNKNVIFDVAVKNVTPKITTLSLTRINVTLSITSLSITIRNATLVITTYSTTIKM